MAKLVARPAIMRTDGRLIGIVIQGIPKEFFRSITFRYASQRDSVEVLEDMGFQAGTTEKIDFLRDRHEEDSLESLLDKPFEAKPQINPQPTRFSDGTFRVFYSALEIATAEVEALERYFRLAFGNAREPRTVYYMVFSCNYAGATKDLRPHIAILPCLVEDEADYAGCHRIAIEAVKDGLTGILTPSARKPDGTCLPVFRREALSEPGETRVGSISRHDPETGLVSSSRAS